MDKLAKQILHLKRDALRLIVRLTSFLSRWKPKGLPEQHLKAREGRQGWMIGSHHKTLSRSIREYSCNTYKIIITSKMFTIRLIKDTSRTGCGHQNTFYV